MIMASRSQISQYTKDEAVDIFNLSTTNSRKTWSGKAGSGNKWAIHSGHALDVLREIPSGSVDYVITSPPYFWLRDYKIDEQIGWFVLDFPSCLIRPGEALNREF